MNTPLANIRIVLLQTFHPGNIGAVARAMKTMGLNDLVLVSPKEYPSEEATSRAAGATDVLNNAIVVDSMQAAIKDRTQVFATTARQQRKLNRPKNNCEMAVDWIKKNPAEKIAIVFGRERMGMTNDDLALCQQMLYIEGNPEYDVLNMASAVQIVCYELFKQLNNGKDFSKSQSPALAPQENLNQLYDQLQTSLESTGYLNTEQPSEVMNKLKTLFHRCELSQSEVNMLRGVIKSLSRQ